MEVPVPILSGSIGTLEWSFPGRATITTMSGQVSQIPWICSLFFTSSRTRGMERQKERWNKPKWEPRNNSQKSGGTTGEHRGIERKKEEGDTRVSNGLFKKKERTKMRKMMRMVPGTSWSVWVWKGVSIPCQCSFTTERHKNNGFTLNRRV